MIVLLLLACIDQDLADLECAGDDCDAPEDAAHPVPESVGTWVGLACDPHAEPPTASWTLEVPVDVEPAPLSVYLYSTNDAWSAPLYTVWDTEAGAVGLTAQGTNTTDCVAWVWTGAR